MCKCTTKMAIKRKNFKGQVTQKCPDFWLIIEF